jgi:PIN domain nuclease of toxin-antitoxin system
MRVLLDTHTLIWWVDQDSLLTRPSHAAIADPGNDRLVSAATVWEIAIKLGMGKLSLSMPYRQWMNEALAGLQALLLPITVEYAERQAELPSHHRDRSTGFSSPRHSSRMYRWLAQIPPSSNMESPGSGDVGASRVRLTKA